MMEALVDCMTPDWTKQPQIAQGKGQSFGTKAKGDVKRDVEPYAAKRHAQRLLSFLTVARAFFSSFSELTVEASTASVLVVHFEFELGKAFWLQEENSIVDSK